MSKRAVIIGASFNPVHEGHLAVARAAAAEAEIGRVIMLPCGQHAFGKQLAPKQDRLKMLELAVKQSDLNLEIDPREILSDQISYTYRTLKNWQRDNPGWQPIFILGSENLASFDKWHEAEQLVSEFEIWVIDRDDLDVGTLIKRWGANMIEWHPKIELPEENLHLSSTIIRERVKNSQSVTGLVSPKVAQYIKQHQLYHKQ